MSEVMETKAGVHFHVTIVVEAYGVWMPGVWGFPSWWPDATITALAWRSSHDGHELAQFCNLHNDF